MTKDINELLYGDLPTSEIDFDKVEMALGFELFYWQKTYIQFGSYRRSGKSVAVALHILLNNIDEPLTLPKPRNNRESIEQQILVEIYKKLQSANVPCRQITNMRGKKDD